LYYSRVDRSALRLPARHTGRASYFAPRRAGDERATGSHGSEVGGVRVVNQILPPSTTLRQHGTGKTGPAAAARDLPGMLLETAAIFRLPVAKIAAEPFGKLNGNCGGDRGPGVAP